MSSSSILKSVFFSNVLCYNSQLKNLLKEENMRTQKTVFVAGILLLLGLFIAGVADAAPDMSKWEGKWFSYTATVKGIEFNGTSFTKGGNKESGYFKIWDWDGENFQIDTYYLDDGVWNSDARTIEFLAGNDLKFLFLLQNEEDGFAIAGHD